MEKKAKRLYLLLGISVCIMLLCFALCIYFTISELLGELVAPGIIMVMAWLPCVGIAVLQVLVYIMGLRFMKNDLKEMRKYGKYTWIFGIIASVYMVGFGLVFVFTDFNYFRYYLIEVMASMANLVFLVIWLTRFNRIFKI